MIFGFIASLTWGTAFTFGKYGQQHGADPIYLAFGRYLVAAVLLSAVALAVRRREVGDAVRRRPQALAFLGLTGIFGMGGLSFAALNFTTSINTSVLMNANPIFTVLLATAIGERLTSDKLIGVVAGMAGCVLVVTGGTTEPFRLQAADVLGCLLSIGSAMCWSLYTVYGKGIVRDYGGLTATAGALVVGAVLFLVYMLAVKTPVTLAPNIVWTILYLGIVPTAVGFLIWYLALATEDASRLASLQFVAPLFTAVLGWLFLEERMTIVSITGMVLIFAGIYVASIRANAAS